MVIVPLHVVPPIIPDGLTETVKFVLVGPAMKLPIGVTVNQLLLVQLCCATWAVAFVLEGAVTASVCGAGTAPPTIALNVNPEALNVRAAVVSPVTLRVTLAV